MEDTLARPPVAATAFDRSLVEERTEDGDDGLVADTELGPERGRRHRSGAVFEEIEYAGSGGVLEGLGPLLPLFDHLLTTLVSDLEERGLLDQVLVIAMGEFGRTPMMGTQDSTDGRNHWPEVMSMCLAGGGLRHGQVIGATERDGGQIKERQVTPADLAATIYRHLGVPLDATYLDNRGRPRYIVDNDGAPIQELV